MDVDGDPLIGTTLDGRYSILECIGEGGMGRVYRAVHTRMSRKYAVKVLFGDLAGDKRMRSRFSREAEAVSRLEHPNVISVVDFGESESGLLYLVMDLAEGLPLSEVIEQRAPMPEDEIIMILAKLCQGLGHAHARGLIHRDFKGENVILVEEEGEWVPKILDFGICMMVEQNPGATMLTSDGIVIGTPAMMSPEQATGDIVDHRSDQFSLGIVLYQMLTGKMPFDGSPIDMARQNLYATMPSVKERAGIDCHSNLEEISFKLSAKKPENRYEQVRDVIKELDLFDGMLTRSKTSPPFNKFQAGSSTKSSSHAPHHTEAIASYGDEATIPILGTRKNALIALAGTSVLLLLLLFFGFRSTKAETDVFSGGMGDTHASGIDFRGADIKATSKEDATENKLNNIYSLDTNKGEEEAKPEDNVEAKTVNQEPLFKENASALPPSTVEATERTETQTKRTKAPRKTKATAPKNTSKRKAAVAKKPQPKPVTNSDVTKACGTASQLLKALNKKNPKESGALKSQFRNIDITSAYSNANARPSIKRKCDKVAQLARKKL